MQLRQSLVKIGSLDHLGKQVKVSCSSSPLYEGVYIVSPVRKFCKRCTSELPKMVIGLLRRQSRPFRGTYSWVGGKQKLQGGGADLISDFDVPLAYTQIPEHKPG